MSPAFEGITVEARKGYWVVFPELCKGCGLCIAKCPRKCMSWSDYLGVYGTPSVKINKEECNSCGICEMFCPDCAIAVVKKESASKESSERAKSSSCKKN